MSINFNDLYHVPAPSDESPSDESHSSDIITSMPEDRIRRGSHKSSFLGALTFVGLRGLDPFLQHSILAHGLGTGLITALGSHVFAQGPTSNTGIALLDNLHLSPYRLALFGMAVASSVKHAIWKLAISNEEMPAGDAAAIAAFNTVCNSLNTLFFICAATSAGFGRGEGPGWEGFPGLPLQVGGAMFVTGILVETISEVQRKAFKSKPENKGKAYTGGLFALARHINYGGYTLWRSGFALACAGWTWGAAVGCFFAYDFATRGIPLLDEYCHKRYADMWIDYKKKVPYTLIPYIW